MAISMKAKGENIIFKTADENEVRTILNTIYASLTWGVVAEDYIAAVKHDPQSFTVAKNEKGEMVAGVIFMKINKRLVGFGLFFVKEEYRGTGIGLKIHDIGFNRISQLNVALVPADAMLHKYKTKYYPIESEIQGLRFIGEINITLINPSADITVEDYNSDMVTDLLDYDKTVDNEDRAEFMKIFLSFVKGHIVVARNSGKICGYGILRGTVNKLGPVFADNPVTALALIHALLCKSSKNIKVMIDIPSCNSAIINLAKESNMKFDWKFSRLWSKEEVKINWSKVHSLLSLDVVYI